MNCGDDRGLDSALMDDRRIRVMGPPFNWKLRGLFSWFFSSRILSCFLKCFCSAVLMSAMRGLAKPLQGK